MRYEEMPKLFGADTYKVEICNAEDLKNAGQIFTSYGISVGETVEVPATREECVIVKQPSRNLRQDGTRNMQYFLSVTRVINGNRKNGWLSMGSLVRQDANQEPIDKVSAEMLQFDNIEDRVQKLVGKKITCKTRENRQAPEFLNRVRTGNIIERPTNIYEWA